MLDPKRFPINYMPKPPFSNVEYRMKLTHTVNTDKRIMSFVDVLWGFEVTGGFDQWEPLTIIEVRRSGYGFRAGIRVNDRIVRINDTYADTLTLREAQMLIRRSGKHLRIYVSGEEDPYADDEFTVDFWFTPPRSSILVDNVWGDCFPWNDRKKQRYRESNCFMVPSKEEERIIQRALERKEPPVPSKDNIVIDQSLPKAFVDSREPSEPREALPIVPVIDESNVTETAPENIIVKSTAKKYYLVK